MDKNENHICEDCMSEMADQITDELWDKLDFFNEHGQWGMLMDSLMFTIASQAALAEEDPEKFREELLRTFNFAFDSALRDYQLHEAANGKH